MKNIFRALKITTGIFGTMAAVMAGVYYGMSWLMQQPTWVSFSIVGGVLFVAFTFYIWTWIDAKLI